MSPRTLLFALLITLVAVPSIASAGQPDDADARFEALLKHIDVVPDRAGLERVWPDARERLMRAATEDARDQYTRSRALSMLSYFPEPAVRSTLVSLTAHPDVEVRRLAVYTAARTFGVPGDRALVALVEDAASDVAPRVREHAVRGLRWIDHPAAAAALERLERSHRGERLSDLARRTLDRRARRLSSPQR